jgi:hypothetical protein
MMKESNLVIVNTDIVKSRMIIVRNSPVLLDRDVAELYGVQTREINQAVRNNPNNFPEGYVCELTKDESVSLRSKFLTLESNTGRGKYSKHAYKAFTEKVG